MITSQEVYFLFSSLMPIVNCNNGSTGGTSCGGNTMLPSDQKRKISMITDGINYLPNSWDFLGNKNILIASLECDLRRN